MNPIWKGSPKPQNEAGMDIKTRVIILGFTFILGIVAGRWTKADGPLIVEHETAQPIIRHKDGAITLARVGPSVKPPSALSEPPGVVTRTRAFMADIQPLPEPSRIQFDLVTMADGSQRITAKGPALAGGEDFPIAPPKTVQKWTLGAGWNGREAEGMILKSRNHFDYGITFAPINKPTRVGVMFLLRW